MKKEYVRKPITQRKLKLITSTNANLSIWWRYEVCLAVVTYQTQNLQMPSFAGVLQKGCSETFGKFKGKRMYGSLFLNKKAS